MSLFSTQWHRVASTRPRLLASVRVRRQRVRGQTWMVLCDDGSARSMRLNAAAYAFAARLDGRHSVQAVWDGLQARDDADEAPTQDEAIELLARLREAGLIDLDVPADFAALLPHLDAQRPGQRRFGLLSWRLPLLNPTRLLSALAGAGALMGTRGALAIWLIAAMALAALTLRHADALWAHAQTWMSTPRYLLLGVLLYPPIKLLHELAHGLIARRFGVPVREAGVTLMAMCMPVPYVDVSASAALPRAGDRLAIVGAGIMAESGVALAGLVLWLATDAGWAHDAGFVMFFIGAVSTLLFNANPLQRFDGYYLLCDALGLPNLATRSRQWWLQAVQRRVLGARALSSMPTPMPVAPGERPWLVAYAPLAWAYQGTVALAIAGWLMRVQVLLGALALAWFAWVQLVQPVARAWHDLKRLAPHDAAASRRLARAALAVPIVSLLLALVPLPQRIVAGGVIWPPDDAQLRADADGVVRAVLRRDGELVGPGEVLIELDNAALVAREAAEDARVEGLRHEAVQTQSAGGADASDARAALERAQAGLARTRERLGDLQIRARRAGRLVLPQGLDLAGTYVRRGALLGQVQDGSGPMLRLAIEQDDAAELGRGATAVHAWLADGRARDLRGRLLHDAYAASSRLPSPALGTLHGGTLQTDPKDPEALKTLRPVVLVDVALPPEAADVPTGLRGWARIDQGHAPAALQALHWARRAWQRHAEPAR